MSCMKFWLPHSLYKGEGGDYVAKQKEINKLVAVSWPLRWWGSLSASVKKGKSVVPERSGSCILNIFIRSMFKT